MALGETHQEVKPQEAPAKMPPGVTLVALPFVSKQGFTGATTQSLILGILAGGFKNCKFLFLQDHSQTGARNSACETAIKDGCEWLFFVDSDMDFPVETLPRLKAIDADIACTDMWSRNIPSFRTVMKIGPPDSSGNTACIPHEGGGVERIDVCGMACTLIKTKLLVAMRDAYPDQPWFWVSEHGEDAMFCFKAKDLGAVAKCDFGIMAGHWGVMRMAGQDFTRDAKNQPMTVAHQEMMRRMRAVNLPEPEGAVK